MTEVGRQHSLSLCWSLRGVRTKLARGRVVSRGDGVLEVGTEEWLLKTGGRLTLRQALVLSAQGSAQVLNERLSRTRPDATKRPGQASRIEHARVHLMSVLESQRERVLERQGQALLHHGCRTYLLGAALLDDEPFGRVNHAAAVVAALAHDDGLVHPGAPGVCFTADSAREAATMMQSLGATGDASVAARSAVIAHFQPTLPSRAGAEAQLVALGASADVMGFGLRRIDPLLAQSVWQEWPDLAFLSGVRALLKGERKRAPRTRPGVLALSGMPYLLRSAQRSIKE